MKRIIKVIVLLVIFVFLVIDFIGLWKYKLSGKKYEVATNTESDVAVEEAPQGPKIEYTDLSSTTISNDEVVFIKNIEDEDQNGKYVVQGLVFAPYEVSKDDYNSLRAGKSVEILGKKYAKSQIKSNNLILKSSDSNAKEYYINYDTKNKKYILKEKKTDYTVYKTTEQYVKASITKGTTFSVVKNGKTENKKIQDVIDIHKNLEEPQGETGAINTCVFTFNKNGDCSKIVETCR